MTPSSTRQKIIKHPVDPSRICTVPRQFAALDRRLVHAKHIMRMSREQIALYVFLHCVSDAQGLSFYSETRIEEYLHLRPSELRAARDGLVEAQHLLYDKPIYQLLNLPRRSS